MALPRILIIDDQFGGARSESENRNRNREGLCFSVGIQDCTGDVEVEAIVDPVAEAVFCRGQIIENGQAYNDLGGTLDTVRKGWQSWPRWALILLDMQFKTGPIGPDGEPLSNQAVEKPESYFGLTILKELRHDPVLCEAPVVILSSMQREQIEPIFADLGVFDFIDKNELSKGRLEQLLHDHGLLESETMIGHSIAFLKCLREARQRTKHGNDNILLLGETGTGKDLLAKYCHAHSPTPKGPFVTVFTSGVPETLIDDRIFGHEKGAHQGADKSVPGLAERADGGTLFIDEFGDISPEVQPKLLRLLDTNIRETQRLGATARPWKVTLQVILATKDLDLLQKSEDDFRKDLLYRVNITEPIRLPSLRERREDIPLLVEHFVRKFERSFHNDPDFQPRTVTPEALEDLCERAWEGNIRDLEGVIRSAVSRYLSLRVLSVEHIRPSLESRTNTPPRTVVRSKTETKQHHQPQNSFADLLLQMNTLDFSIEPEKRGEWAGKLPDLRIAYGNLLVRLVRAALLAKRKSTVSCPEGEVNFAGAMGFLNGKTMAVAKARDLIKRLFKFPPEERDLEERLDMDPVVELALKEAQIKRPSRKGQKRQ